MAIAVIRTLIIYLVMVVSVRVMGKRQLGELEPSELVVALLIADIAATPLADIGTPLLYGLAPIVTLVTCEVIMSALVLKSRFVRRVIAGKPSIIIENGKLLQREMRRNRYTVDELMEHLRKSGVTDLKSVKHAILETDGTLSVILFTQDSPVTPRQLNVVAADSSLPTVLISDGELVHEGMKQLGLDESWLYEKLKLYGYNSVSEVFLLTADTEGTTYWTTKEM